MIGVFLGGPPGDETCLIRFDRPALARSVRSPRTGCGKSLPPQDAAIGDPQEPRLFGVSRQWPRFSPHSRAWASPRTARATASRHVASTLLALTILSTVTSKPYAGRLSTGEPYLIATTTADSGKRRSPLTIAMGPPGGNSFEQVFVIRHTEHDGPGESHPKASLAYPYAIEHDDRLYVGYSNNGGLVGRVGQGRELANNNSAELAVSSLASLRNTAAN
jgi:hypothetical protein